jgi:hypothetical protein
MTLRGESTDASYLYHEDATADVARMDSSAVYGNLADAMKNAIVVFQPTQIVDTTVVVQPSEDGDIIEPPLRAIIRDID